jgi:hypothetical protein
MAGEIRGLINIDDGTEFLDARTLPLLIPDGGTLTVSGGISTTLNISGGAFFGDGSNLTNISVGSIDLTDYAKLSLVNSISANLQAQILTNDADILGLQSQTQTISGDLDALEIQFNNFDLTYATDANLAQVSAYLQGQILTNDTDISDIQTAIVNITGGLPQLDTRYVEVTGDTMTGTLFVPEIGSHDNFVNEIHTSEMHLESLSGGNVPAYEEGMLFYNGEKRTLNLYNDIEDVALDLGEENWIRIVNKTGSQINNGQVVYINGAQGNRPTVALADNADELTADDVIGLATHNITNNQEGFITTFGVVREINTSSWTTGDQLFLDSSGGLTNIEPETPLHRVRIGYALNSTNDGQVLVVVQSSGEIKDLHDVLIATPQQDEILAYSDAISGWANTSVLSAVSGALDARYVNVDGDIMTGDLTLSSNLIISNLDSISGQSLTTDVNGQITNSGFQDTITVTLSSHGFTQLDAIYNNSGTWTKAQSDDVNTLGVALVTEIIDTDNFKFASVGQAVVSTHGLTVGQYYYVSPDTAGQLVISPPTGITEYSNPIVYALDDDRILVFPWRPNQALNRNKLQVSTVTASSYNATVFDEVILGDATSNNITVTLPPPNTDNDGLRYDVKKIDSSLNTLSVVSISGNIDDVLGTTGITISTQNNSKTLVSDGNNYWAI